MAGAKAGRNASRFHFQEVREDKCPTRVELESTGLKKNSQPRLLPVSTIMGRQYANQRTANRATAKGDVLYKEKVGKLYREHWIGSGTAY
jgi:hypothetical protein